jgi:hypothetical protein
MNKVIRIMNVRNGYVIDEEEDNGRSWVAKSTYDISEVCKEIFEPPAIPAPPESPLDAICQKCGERRGKHTAEGGNCPMPEGSACKYMAYQTFQGEGEV